MILTSEILRSRASRLAPGLLLCLFAALAPGDAVALGELTPPSVSVRAPACVKGDSVPLVLHAPDEVAMSQVRFAGESSGWSGWREWQGDRVSAPVSSGAGSKRVLVQAADAAGNRSAIAEASFTRIKPKLAAQRVLMIGDSLTAQIAEYLASGQMNRRESTCFRHRFDAQGGIRLAGGMRRYDAVRVKPKVVFMGLFSNNEPTEAQHVELKSALRRTIRDARTRDGLVVWATVYRHNAPNRDYTVTNRILHRFAARNGDAMRLINWELFIRANLHLLDGRVHATPEGYAERLRMIAEAILR